MRKLSLDLSLSSSYDVACAYLIWMANDYQSLTHQRIAAAMPVKYQKHKISDIFHNRRSLTKMSNLSSAIFQLIRSNRLPYAQKDAKNFILFWRDISCAMLLRIPHQEYYHHYASTFYRTQITKMCADGIFIESSDDPFFTPQEIVQNDPKGGKGS